MSNIIWIYFPIIIFGWIFNRTSPLIKSQLENCWDFFMVSDDWLEQFDWKSSTVRWTSSRTALKAKPKPHSTVVSAFYWNACKIVGTVNVEQCPSIFVSKPVDIPRLIQQRWSVTFESHAKIAKARLTSSFWELLFLSLSFIDVQPELTLHSFPSLILSSRFTVWVLWHKLDPMLILISSHVNYNFPSKLSKNIIVWTLKHNHFITRLVRH